MASHERIIRIAGLAILAATASAAADAAPPRLPIDAAELIDSDFAVQANRPGAAPVNRIEVAPRVALAYDSNVFQLNEDRIAGKPSDTIVTPGIGLQVSRAIGRNSVDLSADIGYDLHRRYTTLDQIRVAVSGGAHLALGGVCTADPRADVRIRQNNDAALATTAKNAQTVQDYALTLACQRAVGLYPSVTLTRGTVDNGDAARALVNQRSEGVEGGIGYAVPSIGALLLEYGAERIRQPNLPDAAGGDAGLGGGLGGSDVTRYAATFTRAVAPRLSFQLGGRYLVVKPKAGGQDDFNGGGYDVTVDYHPSPRYALVLTADRDVSGSGDVAVSYVIDTRYALRGTAKLSSRARLSLSGEYADLHYRGEDPLLYPVPRVYEHAASVATDMRYDLGQAIELGLYARYAVVRSAGTLYDYDRGQGGLSVAARF